MSFIRRRLTFANVVLTLALVFAMTGGAYAAKKYLITSTKQISPKVLKQLKGNAGPAGPEGKQGPQGPKGDTGAAGAQGPKGDTGTQGATGAKGADGKSVVTGEEATGTSNCGERGGVWVEVEGSSAKRYVCNGKDAYTGGTMTGDWSFVAKGPLGTFVTVSFPHQLPAEPTFNWIAPENVGGNATTACPGNAHKPAAAPGNLCFYGDAVVSAGTGPGLEPQSYASFTSDKTSGATVEFAITPGAEGYGYGSWAVTPCPEGKTTC